MYRRLRIFLYTLASSGARVGELSSIRWKDVDLNANPVSIHLRAETTKTKVGRTVYITRETAEELKQWLLYRQTCRKRSNDKGVATTSTITIGTASISSSTSKSVVDIDPNEFVFQVYDKKCDPKYIEHKMQTSFTSHLKSLGLYVVREFNSVDGNVHVMLVSGRPVLVIVLPGILKHSLTKVCSSSTLALAVSIVAVHVPSVGVAVMPLTVEGLHVDIGVGDAYYATPCY